MVAMRNQEAPYSGIAGLMAAQGRYGDTELLHVRPDELAGLSSMGQLTVNPETGLPEAFNFRSLLPAVGAIAGTVLLGPGLGTAFGGSAFGAAAGAGVGAGVGSFAGGLAAGQSPTDALVGGLISGATAGVMTGMMGPSSAALEAGLGVEGASTAAAQQASNQALTSQGLQTGTNVASAGANAGTALSNMGPVSVGPVSPSFFPAAGQAPLTTTQMAGASQGFQTVPVTAEIAKQSGVAYAAPFAAGQNIPATTFVRDFGIKGAVAAQKALEQAGGAPLTTTQMAGALLQRPSTYTPLAFGAMEAVMTPPEFDPNADGGLAALEDTYTRRPLRLEGGEPTQEGFTQEDYTRLALEGGISQGLTPFRYVDDDTVTLAEGGEVAVEETDTVVEEETVDSENKRKEEEILQKKKAASEVDKFISDAVGGATLNAMVGQVNQDPGAIATPYGQGGDGFNVGADFGFNKGGLIGLANGGTPRNGSKKNSFTPKQKVVYDFYKEKKYPSESIAAIMGNIAVEAPTFKGTQRESGKKKGLNQGLGLFQFTQGRQKDYKRYLKDNKLPNNEQNQMEYAHEQMTSTEGEGVLPYDAGPGNRQRLRKILLGKGMGAVEDRAKAISDLFLRPGVPHIERRMEESLNMFHRIPDVELYNKGGGIGQYFEGKVIGPGDGQSDQVLFEVEGDNPDMALLSPDEYVIPADTVAMIGSGSSTSGAKKLDGFVKNIRHKATGNKKQQKPIKQGLESFLA